MKRSVRSVNITLALVVLLCVFFAAMLVFAPRVFTTYCEAAHKSEGALKSLIGVFYACTPSAIVTLYCIIRFLNNLKKGEVFVPQTVKYLRILSYTCLSVIPLTLPLCYYFLAGFPIPASAACMWLFLRVLKNAFEYGNDIKNENDLTV